MDHRQQYRQAQLDLIDLVKDLKDEDLNTTSTCGGWTVRDILKHVTQNAYAAAARGQGEKYDAGADQRLGNDLREEFRIASDAAWEYNKRDERLTESIDFAGSQQPGAIAVAFGFADILIHQWDISRSLGRPIRLRAEHVTDAIKISELIPAGDDFRGPGKPFAPIVEIDSDDPQDRLLSLSGRDPSWTPAAA